MVMFVSGCGLLERRRRPRSRNGKQNEKTFTGSVLGSAANGRRQLALAAKEVRARTTDAVSYLSLDGSTMPGKLEHLQGREGWWFVYRFDITGLKPEERLVHLVLLKHGESFRALPVAEGELFSRVTAREETVRKPSAVSVSLQHEAALIAARDEIIRSFERKNAIELDASKDRADRFGEDTLLTPRQHVERARGEWEAGRSVVLGIDDPSNRVKARANAERLEREYRRKLQQLRQAEEQRYAEKDRTLAALSLKAKVTTTRALVASAYFFVT